MPSVDEEQHENGYKLMMHTRSPLRMVERTRKKVQLMLIRFGCVRIGPRCTYSVPLRVRPPAFSLDFLATRGKVEEMFIVNSTKNSRWVFSPRSKLYIRIPAKTMVMRSMMIESTAEIRVSRYRVVGLD